jgi:hypothetical protein
MMCVSSVVTSPRAGLVFIAKWTDMITRKIQAADSGKSPYIQIPREIARLLGWKRGDTVEIDADTRTSSITLHKQ